MTSEAMKNVEDARKKYIDNRVYGTEKYFEMRRINKMARTAEQGPRPSMEDIIRVSDSRKPNRLSPSELDPLTGKIAWPPILRDAQYEQDRMKLEELYGARAFSGFLTGSQLTEVNSTVGNIEAELKKKISEYPPQSYVQAKSFLRSLAYEATLQPG
jgi:hypothetical protein